MARRAVAYVVIATFLFALMVDANPGRKIRQLVTGTGATTAAASATADAINKAIDNKATVGQGGSAANLAAKPKPQATGPPSRTSKGTAAEGAAQNSQAKTSAAISTYASGTKPAAKPAAKPAPTIQTAPKAVAAAPKSSAGAAQASGTATAAQSATQAAIEQKVSVASNPGNRGL